jgi:hypothetical protein
MHSAASDANRSPAYSSPAVQGHGHAAPDLLNFQLANSPSGEISLAGTLGLIKTASAALSSSGLEVKK